MFWGWNSVVEVDGIEGSVLMISILLLNRFLWSSGAYRLLYLLVNDIYIITIDIDHHSPFLALDVLEKVRDVVYTSMSGNVAYSEVEKNKISFYYAFRRCINGMEGASVLNIPLRQIRLANDPLTVYTVNNELLDINDCLNTNEIPRKFVITDEMLGKPFFM